MRAEDAQSTVTKALKHADLGKKDKPKLHCDNGSSYIAAEFNDFLQEQGMQVLHGPAVAPIDPMQE